MWIKEAEPEPTIAPPKYRSLYFPQPPRRSHQGPRPPLTRLPGRLCSHSGGGKVDSAAGQRCILPAFLGPSGRVGSDRLYWEEERAPLLGNKQRVLLRPAPRLWLLWIPPRCGSTPARSCLAEPAARPARTRCQNSTFLAVNLLVPKSFLAWSLLDGPFFAPLNQLLTWHSCSLYIETNNAGGMRFRLLESSYYESWIHHIQSF